MVKRKEPFTAALEDGSIGDSDDRRYGGLDSRLPKDVRGRQQEESQAGEDHPDWIQLARDSYRDSSDFMDSGLRAQWERNQRSFNSQHPSGSKYLSDAFKNRTKLFRPKTRAAMRQAEAALAASYFSNEDVLAVKAVDESNSMQVASAAVHKELIQYRITTPSPRVALPWFMTAVGAFQDAQKYGCVFSKQSWEYRYRTEEELVPSLDDYGMPVYGEEGEPVFEVREKIVVIRDKPRIDIIPPENIRIDRASDWRDPINSSPYLIIEWPMYIQDVERLMNEDNPKTGQPKFNSLSRSELKSAKRGVEWDSTRQQREGNRQDSKESETTIDEYHVVWVNENFVQWGGRDWVYYTAGTEYMLSEPKPIEEVYPYCDQGDRPVVMGIGLIETNKIYPAGKPELTQSLQSETNDVANLRLDNVKLALNKRYLVRRGRQVDLKSILRNSPGSVTLVTDVESDVKAFETRDVTGSAYQEQDRINVDFDEIAGNFSAGTVQTNRKLNETVGGMEILAGAAGSIGELDLRVFTVTWTEPVLRQVVRMEQEYETDEVILAVAGGRAELMQKFGLNTINDELLRQDLVVRLNVGIGATDPMQRLEKFKIGAGLIAEMFGDTIIQKVNDEEVIKEIFGTLGFRDGSRFFKFGEPGPDIVMLKRQIEDLQRQVDMKEASTRADVQTAQITADSRLRQTVIEVQGRLQQEAMRQSKGGDSPEDKSFEHALKQRAQISDERLGEAKMNMDREFRERDFAFQREKHDDDMDLRRMEILEKIDLAREELLSNERVKKYTADVNAKAAKEKAASKPSSGE